MINGCPNQLNYKLFSDCNWFLPNLASLYTNFLPVSQISSNRTVVQDQLANPFGGYLLPVPGLLLAVDL